MYHGQLYQRQDQVSEADMKFKSATNTAGLSWYTNLSIHCCYPSPIIITLHINALLKIFVSIFFLSAFLFYDCFIGLLLLYMLAGGSNVSLASTSSVTSVSISSEFVFFIEKEAILIE